MRGVGWYEVGNMRCIYVQCRYESCTVCIVCIYSIVRDVL